VVAVAVGVDAVAVGVDAGLLGVVAVAFGAGQLADRHLAGLGAALGAAAGRRDVSRFSAGAAGGRHRVRVLPR
jgi:hypothetical protein